MKTAYPQGITLAALFGLLLTLTPAQAEPMSREQGDAILEELRKIREALERQPVPAQAAPSRPSRPAQERTGRISIENAYALGKDNAPLTMVLFTDYQCPFCKRFETQTFAEIKKNWIDTGKLRYVVHDQPLDFHAHAMKAAEAARCAGEQGKYWELREKLIANAEQLQREKLPDYAQETGLDVGEFSACLGSGRHTEKIRAEIAEARTQGITGTPSFIVGKSNGKSVEGALLVGAMPYMVFEQKLQELFAKQ